MTDPYYGDCENCATEDLIDYNTNLCANCYRAFNNGYKAADFMNLKPIDAQDRATHYVISHALFEDYKKRYRLEERDRIVDLLRRLREEAQDKGLSMTVNINGLITLINKGTD